LLVSCNPTPHSHVDVGADAILPGGVANPERKEKDLLTFNYGCGPI